jgi:hypothetical protein
VLRRLAVWCIAAGVLTLMGCRAADAPGPEPLAAADFESGAFFRRHPSSDRRVDSTAAPRMAWIYSLRDAETSGLISLVVHGTERRIESITVTWPSGEQPAGWNSIKKQFVADLLESSFSEVDYGQLSAYVVAHSFERFQSATPGVLGGTEVKAGRSGGRLVLALRRASPR